MSDADTSRENVMHRVASAISGLSHDDKTIVLLSVLMQEICMLPPSDREDELASLLSELPMLLRATQEGMRQGLAAQAKRHD